VGHSTMQTDPKRARAAMKSGGVLTYGIAPIVIVNVFADSESGWLGRVSAHRPAAAGSTRRICSTDRRVAAAMPCSDKP
jgi:hypothetical protein